MLETTRVIRHTLAACALLVMWGCQSMGTQTPSGGQSTETKPAAAAKNAEKPAKPELPQGFTCCNFHYEGDWINDANYTTLPMIPAGTPAKITGYGRHRVYVEIGGKKMRLGLDYGREQQTLQAWASKMIVADDPKSKLATYPANIRTAIQQGKVAPGMTKEQVIMSVGYPLASENPTLDAPMWRMWVSSFGEYQLLWDANGRVKEVVTDALTRNLVVYQGQ